MIADRLLNTTRRLAVAGAIGIAASASVLFAARLNLLPGPLPISADALADGAFIVSQIALLAVSLHALANLCRAGQTLSKRKKQRRSAALKWLRG